MTPQKVTLNQEINQQILDLWTRYRATRALRADDCLFENRIPMLYERGEPGRILLIGSNPSHVDERRQYQLMGAWCSCERKENPFKSESELREFYSGRAGVDITKIIDVQRMWIKNYRTYFSRRFDYLADASGDDGRWNYMDVFQCRVTDQIKLKKKIDAERNSPRYFGRTFL